MREDCRWTWLQTCSRNMCETLARVTAARLYGVLFALLPCTMVETSSLRRWAMISNRSSWGRSACACLHTVMMLAWIDSDIVYVSAVWHAIMRISGGCGNSEYKSMWLAEVQNKAESVIMWSDICTCLCHTVGSGSGHNCPHYLRHSVPNPYFSKLGCFG